MQSEVSFRGNVPLVQPNEGPLSATLVDGPQIRIKDKAQEGEREKDQEQKGTKEQEMGQEEEETEEAKKDEETEKRRKAKLVKED